MVSALAGTAVAAPAPAWSIEPVGLPTHFPPGSEGQAYYQVSATNVGGGSTDRSPITIVDVLPPGLEVEDLELAVPGVGGGSLGFAEIADEACEEASVGPRVEVRCEIAEGLPFTAEPALVEPGGLFQLIIDVKVSSDATGQLVNEAAVEGGGAAAAATESSNAATAEPAPAGVSYFGSEFLEEDGSPASRASSHPFQYVTTFAVNSEPGPPGGLARTVPAGGDVRNQNFALPMGVAGNVSSLERCTQEQFAELHRFVNAVGANIFRPACPAGSVAGFLILQQLEGESTRLYLPIYSLEPPIGMPAQFGFEVAGAPNYINTRVRSDGDYGITAYLANVTEVKRIMAAKAFFWGVPADPRHDPYRGDCLNENGGWFEKLSLGNCPADIAPTPFFTMPTSCGEPVDTLFSYDTWSAGGVFASKSSSSPPSNGCAEVPFSPSLEARPSTNVTDSPSGLRVDLHVPQSEDPVGRGTAHLRKATVTLPPGLVLNPSSANGLAACSPAQIGLTTAVGAKPAFTAEGAECPDAAKVGTVEIETPLLGQFEGGKVKRGADGLVIPEPLRGSVYLATPHDNPFGSLIALYIAVDDPKTGLVIKLPGVVTPDPETGQLTSTFDNNPQLPFEHLKLRFFEGSAAPLRTPATCGTYTTTSSLTPWSAPESGPPAAPSDTYGISTAPSGGSCPGSPDQLPHAPAFEAGTVSPVAGSYSPLVLKLRRDDGSQEWGALTVDPPAGLLGKLAGIPYCSEGALAAAAARSGAAEKSSPSCSAASRLGTVTVGAGAGPAPYYVNGDAYLAGPYHGAPLSMAIVTPATAGPFDLGTVVVRTALFVDPETARISAKSDPIPRILQGIPLDVRSIDVRLDRPDFTLNPTDCEPRSVDGQVLSTLGQTAGVSSRFQVGECARLGFKPKLSLRLLGKTKRTGNPRLKATLRMPAGGANVGAVTVRLPHSEFLDQGHIRTICTRVQFAAGGGNGGGCPKGSVYGYARAWSPLLDQPLAGPVFLRANGGDRELPDLVAALDGQIDVNLVGYIDSVRGGIRTSFATPPDAPVSKFVLDMQGGKKGLLQNSTDICRGKHRATADFVAQNGKIRRLKPVLKAQCRKGHRHPKHRHSQHRR
ncbi:MAG TPA: hypothetical protein VN732_05220 [Solirubrobacterales bacterium]|nr:hypothetical protein [Solirubrobacterales bacterium]